MVNKNKKDKSKKSFNHSEKNDKKINDIEKKESDEKIIQKQNRLLRNILIGIGIFSLFCFILFFLVKSTSHFTYRGVEFNLVKEGNLIFYQTSLPVYYNNEIRDYNFYIRTDPRVLDEIPFKGEIKFLRNAVLNFSGMKCDGDEIIALANFLKLQSVLGMKVIKDENATCDKEGRYLYFNIYEGNETKITEYSDTCYEIVVSNCEILKAMEKFMVEEFVKINELDS